MATSISTGSRTDAEQALQEGVVEPRRNLLRARVALPIAAGGAAIGHRAEASQEPPHPDAELIALGQAWAVAEAHLSAVFYVFDDEVGLLGRADFKDALANAIDLRRRIAETPATTRQGFEVKIRPAASCFKNDTVDDLLREYLDECGPCDATMLISLARDAMRLLGKDLIA